jgi:hypothetical protein
MWRVIHIEKGRVEERGSEGVRWMQFKREKFKRWLVTSPIGSNDSFKLELSGNWEPPKSSRPLPDGKE